MTDDEKPKPAEEIEYIPDSGAPEEGKPASPPEAGVESPDHPEPCAAEKEPAPSIKHLKEKLKKRETEVKHLKKEIEEAQRPVRQEAGRPRESPEEDRAGENRLLSICSE